MKKNLYRMMLWTWLWMALPIMAVAQVMMFGDTSRTGVPFAKDPHVVNFGGRYLLYFSIPPYKDQPGSGWNIGIAESRDLVNW